MMVEGAVKDVRAAVLRSARAEAESLGSATIEAEHLLLALAADEGSSTGRRLGDAGLDAEALRTALEHETERSLAAVGIAASDFALAAVRGAPRRTTKLAASSKRALVRALTVARARGDRRIAPPHVLIGVLRADVGTVPRALAAADVDRVALADRAERLLA